ncbi:hypothetical protein KI655_15590 [Vibrio sp. D404a]|uniref:DUF4344 domain-containing metallopeptidase n=1 Tax=unclassified Vibrio TaxID=2614977 RepID=UPI0025546EB7|nr:MULTISPECIES: DUF4344 domain-containing metallopeptidase [unclassified Vibrio]MDK9738721.1 hypothetical protein [Vibrio sp. D404a]MDK9798504.1 hypothetical protein [Vibrio sp. D449a]
MYTLGKTVLNSGIACALLAATHVSAETTPTQNISIQYQAPTNELESDIKQAIIESEVNDTLVDLSEQLFPFDSPLVVQYGGSDGPLYDPNTHVIHMPYQFYSESVNYFEKNKYQEKYDKSAQAGAVDTLLHTLLHEAAHAYIADQNIAILGKEEDAADNFATLLLIDYVEHGADAAISAADLFAYESEDRPEYYDLGEYIDEHSFDLQRYFSTLCLVYGSDPESHKNLLDEVEKDYLKDRKEFCVEHYQIMNENWHRYLSASTESE